MNMDPIYTDTLKALMVYKYELEAAVVELERISHHNTILYCVIAALIAGAVAGAYWLGRIHSRRLSAEKLANRLLIRHAESLPQLANEVNKISGKNITLSGAMYDELQGAHPLLDSAAIQVVRESPKWIPATKDGSPIKTTFIFPYVFLLK